MAEGGDVVLHAGQEEVFDWNCSHCETSGTFVEAVVYCPQCEEAYCELCFQGHARFPALKSHKILSKAQQEDWGCKKSNVEENCYLHDGQEFSMYCGKHDVVCCPVCASLDHGSCKELVYIPKVAEEIMTSPELNHTLAEIKSTLSFTQKIKKKKQVLRGVIGDYKSGIFFNLEEEKRKMVETFDQLIKRASEDIDSVYEGTDSKLEVDLKICSDIERNLISTKKLLEDSTSDKQGFLNLKKCQKKLENLKKGMPHDIASIPESKPLQMNEELERVTCQFSSALAKISPIGLYSCEFEIKETRMVNISMEEDTCRCEIIDICILRKKILLSDYNNRKIKSFDTSFDFEDLVDFLSLENSPQGMSPLRNDEAVIAMSNQSLIFVDTSNHLKLTRTVELTHDCFGVALHGNKLYISNNSNTVYIYCMACMPLESVDMYVDYIRGPFVHAGLIKIANNGVDLYIIDTQKGLVKVDKNGKHLFTRTPVDDKLIGGFCLDVHGNMFMSIKSNNSVVQLGHENDLVSKIIATSMQDLDRPSAIAKQTSSLLIANCPKSGPAYLSVLNMRVK